jgi:hypothetical protein
MSGAITPFAPTAHRDHLQDICDIFVFSAKTLKTLDRDCTVACHPPFLPQTVSSHPPISRAATIHPAFYLAVYATLPTVWVAFRYPLAAPSFVCVSSRDVAG